MIRQRMPIGQLTQAYRGWLFLPPLLWGGPPTRNGRLELREKLQSLINQAKQTGFGNQLFAVADIKLREEIFHMPLDRSFTHLQGKTNFLV